MKRFSKLLAVVLAIAVIICPMMSVVSHATTTNGYKIEAIDENNLKLTISSTDGFVAYHATVGFNSGDAFQSDYTDANTGYADGLKVISYTLATAQANDHNAPTIRAHASGTSLNVIVMPSDTNNLDLCTEIVIGIRVASGTTATLTKIQAADNGTVDSDNANLLTFPAANESTGEIDQTAEYATENAKVVTHTHSFTLTSVQDATTLKTAATCTTAAVYYKTCSCGAVSNDDNDTYTVGEPLGHSFTNYVSNNDATCTQDGTKTAKCDNCDETDTVADEGSALGHSYTNYSSDNNATCAQDGTKTAYCDRDCGNTDTITDEGSHTSVAHTWGEYVSNNDAKCLVDGTKTRTCSVCGTTETVEDTGSALGHNFETYTSNENGTHTAKCTRCEETDTKACNTEGTDGACSVCGYKAAPAEIPVISSLQLGRNILARDSLGVRIMVIPTQVSSYDSYYVEVKSKHFRTKDNAPYSLVEDIDLFTYVAEGDEVPDGYHAQAEVNNYHNFEYTGITAFEMTLPMEITLYVCNGGVPVGKSTTYEFSLASRIKTSYIKNNANDAAFVDMLNYGAVVQRYFADANPTSDLAAHGVYPNDDLAQTYATPDSVASVDVSAVSVNANESKPINTAKAAVGKGMQISNKNNIKYLINPSTYEGTTLRVTYEDSYGEDHSVEVDISDCEREGSYYSYFYDKVALYDTHKEVVAGLYNATGELLYTRTYSVASYFFETKANAANKAVGDALMKFTYSLRKNLNLN